MSQGAHASERTSWRALRTRVLNEAGNSDPTASLWIVSSPLARDQVRVEPGNAAPWPRRERIWCWDEL